MDDPKISAGYLDTHLFKPEASFKMALHDVSATQSSRLPFTEEYRNLGRALQKCICPHLGTRTALYIHLASRLA